jgi:hypothetical protein
MRPNQLQLNIKYKVKTVYIIFSNRGIGAHAHKSSSEIVLNIENDSPKFTKGGRKRVPSY